jgi:hypothetical protein
MQTGATRASTQAATRAAVILTSILTQIPGVMKMRIGTESYRACNETFEGGGERREGRGKSIVHLSVEVTSTPSDGEVANLSCERIGQVPRKVDKNQQ